MMARIQNAVVIVIASVDEAVEAEAGVTDGIAIATVVIGVTIATVTEAIEGVNVGVDRGPLPATATIVIAIPVGAKTGMAGSLEKSSARGLNWLG